MSKAAAAAAPQPEAQRDRLSTRQLKGHTGSINSLAAGSPVMPLFADTLLSGSDDGTARLWDLRSSAAGATVFTLPRRRPAVTPSVSTVAYSVPLLFRAAPGFGPGLGSDATAGNCDIASVFAAVGRHVYEYDPRRPEAPLATLPRAADAVSALAAFPGSRGAVLARGDDSGAVSVFARTPVTITATTAAASSDAIAATAAGATASAEWRVLCERPAAHRGALVSSLAWWPQQRSLFSAGSDRVIALSTTYTAATQCPRTAATQGGAVQSAAQSGTALVLEAEKHGDVKRTCTMNMPMITSVTWIPPCALNSDDTKIASANTGSAGSTASAAPAVGASGAGLLAAGSHTGAVLLYAVEPSSSSSADSAGSQTAPSPVYYELGSLLGHSHGVVAVEAPPALAPFTASPASASASASSANQLKGGAAAAAAALAAAPGGFPDALLTAGLDSTLVLWGGLAAPLRAVWESRARAAGAAAAKAALKARAQSKGGKAGAAVAPAIASSRTASAAKQAPWFESLWGDSNADTAAADDEDNDDGNGKDDDDDTDADPEQDTSSTAQRRGKRRAVRHGLSSFVQGLYKPLREFADEFDCGLIRARVPLAGKPSALASDAAGWAWVAGTGADVHGYFLLRG